MVIKRQRDLYPKSIWDEESVLDEFAKRGIKPQHHDRFVREVYDQFSTGLISNLSEYKNPDCNMSPKLEQLCQSGDFTLLTSKVIQRQDSDNLSTTKLLIELQDGEYIETVLMRYSDTQTEEHTRTTICVSSQIGCAQACTFCSTGQLGLKAGLTQGEILEQFIICDALLETVRNVVFMGMGEPLENYENLMKTVEILTSKTRFSLRQNRITVSTVGVVDKMARLIDQCPSITLALSLHAPTQKMRQQIVPSARKYSLKELIDVIDYYYIQTKKKMLIEYVLLDDVNCDPETAHILGKLLQGRGVLLNIIPFNPIPGTRHRTPPPERIAAFANVLTGYGIVVITRKEFGQEISAACGQLSASRHKAGKQKGYTITDDIIDGDDDDDDNNTKNNAGEGQGDDETQLAQPPQSDDEPIDLTDNDQQQQQDTEQSGEPHAPLSRDQPTPQHNPASKDEVLSHGLEGVMSAMGWMQPVDLSILNPTTSTRLQNTTSSSPQNLTITRETIIDDTTINSCSSSTPNHASDIEDLLQLPSETASTPAQQQQPCEKDQQHRLVVEGIDPKDTLSWSRAILSLGICLKGEQLEMHVQKLKKHPLKRMFQAKIDAERAKQVQLLEKLQQQGQSNENDQGGDDIQSDVLLCGDDDDDRPIDNNNNLNAVCVDGVAPSVSGNSIFGLGSVIAPEHRIDQHSVRTAGTYLSRNGPASSLRIRARKKDEFHRVFMPDGAYNARPDADLAVNLDAEQWDAIPEIDEEDQEEEEEQQQQQQQQQQQEKEKEEKTSQQQIPAPQHLPPNDTVSQRHVTENTADTTVQPSSNLKPSEHINPDAPTAQQLAIATRITYLSYFIVVILLILIYRRIV